MKFKIDVSPQDKEYIYSCFEDIFNSNQWTEGKYTRQFEDEFGNYVGVKAVITSSWTGAAMAALEFVNVRNSTVLVPSNTFMATPLAAINSGAHVEFVDCNKDDLCMSSVDLEEKIKLFKPKAVILVHIGGHIAFEIYKIVEICKRYSVVLLEDCAHAHGAEYNGKKAGTFGFAGFYSFYATKTMTTGEGGAIVTDSKELFDFAKKYINYGKFEYDVQGLNFRMNEFTASLGVWQTRKLPEIIAWKNKKASEYNSIYKQHLKLPSGMISGYYKYITFETIEKSTGKVYQDPCHKYLPRNYQLPNTDWIASNHWCVPIYYKGDD